MTIPWAQVAASPEYQKLDGFQKEAARKQYFEQVVAPQVPPADIEKARAQFNEQTEWQPRHRSPQELTAVSDAYQKAHPVTDDMTFGQQFAAGYGKSYVDTGRGLRQIYGSAMDRIAPMQTTTADLVRGRTPSHNDALNAEIAQSRRTDQALDDSAGGTAGNIAGGTVQFFTPVPGSSSVKALQVLGKAEPYAVAALRGATLAGAQPVLGDESRAANAALGGAFSAGGEALPGVLNAGAKKLAAKTDPAIQKAITYLESKGIPLHLSQTTDSRFLKLVGSVVNKLPFSGAQKAGRAQDEAVNRELGKMMGLQGVTKLTDDVMSTAQRRIGHVYDTIFARNNVKITPKVMQELQALDQQIGSDLTPAAATVVRNQVGKFFSKLDASGGIPGRAYQNIRETLFALEKNPESGHLVRDVRKVFERAANDSFQGADAKALKLANERWSNMKIVEKALKQIRGAGGDVRPGSLWPLVNQKYGATKDMRELARAGQLVLKDGVPDSGTAQRGWVQGLLTGGAGTGAVVTGAVPQVAAGIASGALLGRALNSQLAARILPGATAKTLRGAARISKVAKPLGATAAPGLGAWLLPPAAAAQERR